MRFEEMEADYKSFCSSVTRYTLTWISIFSILCSTKFLWCERGEFVHLSKTLVGDHYLYSRDFDI